MSALGQKQTRAVQNGMSALPPKADICSALAHVAGRTFHSMSLSQLGHLGMVPPSARNFPANSRQASRPPSTRWRFNPNTTSQLSIDGRSVNSASASASTRARASASRGTFSRFASPARGFLISSRRVPIHPEGSSTPAARLRGERVAVCRPFRRVAQIRRGHIAPRMQQLFEFWKIYSTPFVRNFAQPGNRGNSARRRRRIFLSFLAPD